jgi:putative transposase
MRTSENLASRRSGEASSTVAHPPKLGHIGQTVNARGFAYATLLVDTLGLPLSVYVTPADVQDRAGARLLLTGLKPLAPRLKKIWADGAYSGEELGNWCEEQGGWELEVVERDKEAKGFEVLPKRWIVERTFGWLRRDRRLAKDYERKVKTSETLIEVAMIRLLLRRLARAA